jgi:hypothetical protein
MNVRALRQLRVAIIVLSPFIVLLASISAVEAQHMKRLRAGLPPLAIVPTAVAAIE